MQNIKPHKEPSLEQQREVFENQQCSNSEIQKLPSFRVAHWNVQHEVQDVEDVKKYLFGSIISLEAQLIDTRQRTGGIPLPPVPTIHITAAIICKDSSTRSARHLPKDGTMVDVMPRRLTLRLLRGGSSDDIGNCNFPGLLKQGEVPGAAIGRPPFVSSGRGVGVLGPPVCGFSRFCVLHNRPISMQWFTRMLLRLPHDGSSRTGLFENDVIFISGVIRHSRERQQALRKLRRRAGCSHRCVTGTHSNFEVPMVSRRVVPLG